MPEQAGAKGLAPPELFAQEVVAEVPLLLLEVAFFSLPVRPMSAGWPPGCRAPPVAWSVPRAVTGLVVHVGCFAYVKPASV